MSREFMRKRQGPNPRSIARAAISAILAVCLSGAGATPPAADTSDYLRPVNTRRYEVVVRTLFPRLKEGAASFGHRGLAPESVAPFFENNLLYRIDPDSFSARLYVDRQLVDDIDFRTDVRVREPFGQKMAVVNLEGLIGRRVKTEIRYLVEVADSVANDVALAQITWPREWPEEVRPALVSDPDFPHEKAIFQTAVEDAVGSSYRLQTPWIVAKSILRYCVEHVRTVSDGRDLAEPDEHFQRRTGQSERYSSPVMFYRRGTLRAAEQGTGSDQDLVSICIATLRAAGIPARIVIGAQEFKRLMIINGKKRLRKRTEPVAWGEIYLPNAGWIPFDPAEMQAHGHRLPPARNSGS